MIEVEKTFSLDEETASRLIRQATFQKSVTLKDIYYDTADYQLTKRDWWLRSRNGRFELKTVYGEERPIHERTHDHYRELETEEAIKQALGWNDQRPFVEVLTDNGYLPFATIVTKRRKYQSGDFHIDLDEMDFGYACADIEQVVDEAQVETATAAIEAFAKQLGLQRTTAGKVIEYLKRHRPDHYRALKEAGVA